MEDLLQIPYSDNLRFASFDISNIYSNIPTSKLPQLITSLCNQNNVNKKTSREITKLTRTILKHNYFQLHRDVYKQTEGLAMGAPTSSIFSEIYLQHLDHTTTADILILISN
jgi:hypothetical protein